MVPLANARDVSRRFRRLDSFVHAQPPPRIRDHNEGAQVVQKRDPDGAAHTCRSQRDHGDSPPKADRDIDRRGVQAAALITNDDETMA